MKHRQLIMLAEKITRMVFFSMLERAVYGLSVNANKYDMDTDMLEKLAGLIDNASRKQ
ncbi:MAG: hypothetical protein QM709_02060 [Spongiibacteraceae bacterium]